MGNLFEPAAAEEIISRLQSLQPDARPRWGKMNAAQMMAHCHAPFETYFSEKKMKQALIGMLFGRMARKKLFSNKPLPRNLPTSKEFIIPDQKDFASERERLVEMINRFSTEGYTVPAQVHPFFGKMSAQEWALLAYKHMDHHLQQFGV
ncbi:MAG TPA: DUF1569 domain-containing protein [Flavisolibacter sp.]|jgi:hypothetical protein